MRETDNEASGSTRFNREKIAVLLSKLAALQGHAVPKHRFSMLERNRDGVDLDTLALVQQAQEMWVTRFTNADIAIKKTEDLEKTDFPNLWVNEVTGDVLLIRGRLASGSFKAEDEQGSDKDLSADVAQEGVFLYLKAMSETSAKSDAAEGAFTARDCFTYALKKRKRIFVEAVMATLLMNILGLFAAFYTMQVYDRVVPTKSFSTLTVLTIGVLIAILFEFTMRQVRAYMMERATKVIDLELSEVFFGKALDIRLDARPPTVGTFASQIRQFESVRNFMATSVLFVLADAPFAIFFIGVIAIIGGYVALVPMILVPIALLLTLMLRGKIERYADENVNESNHKNGLLIEAIDGIESVKAAGAEWKLLDRYRDLSSSIASSDIKLNMLSAKAMNFSMLIQQMNHVGMIAVGAYAITEGSLTLGGLIACAILMGRIFSPLSQVPNLVVQWKYAKIALKNLDGIMNMPGERAADERLIVPDTFRGELQLDNATFGYLPEKPSLMVQDMHFQAGERVAVLGAVGSGKSTLIKILAGLYKPNKGGLYVDGVDAQHISPEFLREHVGYLPQDVRLFNGTLRENLTLGLPAPSDSRILAAARLTGLESSIKAHPRGLELMITEGGRGLSGGQKQLVGLTRLLLAQPHIILLDEPTASMDGQLEDRVMTHLFQELSEQSLIVMVTHKMSLLKHVNRVIVMDKGRVVLDGPRDDVMSKIRQLQKGSMVTIEKDNSSQASS